MTFGKRLKQARLQKKLTQKDVAAYLSRVHEKVSHSTVSNWERDVWSPDVETIKLLAQYLDVSTDYLLGNEPKGQDPIDLMEVLRDRELPHIDGVPIDEETAKILYYQLKAFKEKLLAEMEEKKREISA
jgi:transcriptional regulator with XRE-family HTH domain